MITKNEKRQKFIFRPEWYPSEGTIRFSARYLQYRIDVNSWKKRRDVKKILDAGCGVGRHVIFFSEQGFNVYGIDISKESISIANHWLQEKGLSAHVKIGNVIHLPFNKEYFDVIISYGVLDCMMPNDFKKAMKEISRVCAKGGYVYITLYSTDDVGFRRGKKVAHNSFVLEKGHAKGNVLHYFDLQEIKNAFKGFKIFDIEIHEENFPSLYTKDKTFLQSSTGTKKYIDLSNPIDLNLRHSRWHITAEKI